MDKSSGFEVVSACTQVATLAQGRRLREMPRIQKVHGFGLWRRQSAVAHLWLQQGRIADAEIHWLADAAKVVELKIKRFLKDPL